MPLQADIERYFGPGEDVPGRSILVAGRDAELRPMAVRAVGARRHPERGTVSVFLAALTSERIQAVLTPGSPIAVCFNEPHTHRSIQLKGSVVSCELADEQTDRPAIQTYIDRFAEELELVGLPARITRRMTHWPALRLEFRPEQIFDQSPGPHAGVALGKGGAAT